MVKLMEKNMWRGRGGNRGENGQKSRGSSKKWRGDSAGSRAVHPQSQEKRIEYTHRFRQVGRCSNGNLWALFSNCLCLLSEIRSKVRS